MSLVMKALRRQRVEEIYEKILEDIILKLHKVSKKISIQKGVRQGDTISPKLFTAVLEKNFKSLE